MPRIRTIKPEFWDSEKLARLPHGARLLFIGLWNFADDSGRLRGSLSWVCGRVFPYEPETPIGPWLAELEAIHAIRRYTVAGESYIEIPKFLKHQKIEKASPSRLPPFTEDSPKSRGGIGEESALEQGTGNRDGNRDGAASPPRSEALPNEPHAFMEWWLVEHLAATGEPYLPAKDRDYAMIAEMLRAFPMESLKAKARGLLTCKDEFKIRNGRTIPALKQWANALGEKPKPVPQKRTVLQEVLEDAVTRGMAITRFKRLFFDAKRVEPSKDQIEEFLTGKPVEGFTLEAVA